MYIFMYVYIYLSMYLLRYVCIYLGTSAIVHTYMHSTYIVSNYNFKIWQYRVCVIHLFAASLVLPSFQYNDDDDV
jgi:hypothetical protein